MSTLVKLRIRVLGQLDATANGRNVTPTKPQARQLLALLAAEEFGWLTADVLHHDFWPGNEVKDPKQSLQGAVSKLREQLGKPIPRCVVQHSGAYRLAPEACEIDLVEWTELVARADAEVSNGHIDQALALYTEARSLWSGPPLEGIDETVRLSDAKERLNQSRVQVVFREAQLRQTNEDPIAADLLVELLADAPLREDIAIAAMTALRTAGRRSESVRLAHNVRDELAEAGLVPTPEFAAAEAALHLDPPQVEIDLRAAPTPTLAPPHSLRDAIVAYVTQSLAGQRAPLLYLTPPPGLDLTHVVTLALDQHRQRGDRIIRVRASRDSRSSLRRVLGAFPSSSDRGVVAEHAMAIAAWQAAVADAPTVVVIDAPEELDAWSQKLLDELLEQTIPGLAIVARGSADHTPEHPWSSDAALPPLEQDSIRQLVLERLGAQIDETGASLVASQIASETNGHRLDVEHQIDELFSLSNRIPDSLPESLSPSTILHSLPSSAVEVLAAAAGLGEEVDCQLLSVVLERPVSALLDAIGPAIARGALVESRTIGRWQFASDELRAAALDESDITYNKQLQLIAGRWLVTLPDRRAHGAELLRRALPLSQPDEVAAAAMLAGQELRGAGNYLEAADQFGVARSLNPDRKNSAEGLLAQATCLELGGEHRRSQELFDALFQESAILGDETMLVEAALGGAGQASRIGGLPDRCRRLGITSRRLPLDHPRRDEVDSAFALELISSRRPVPKSLSDQLVRISCDKNSAAGLTASRVLLIAEEVQRGSSPEAAALVAQWALTQSGISHDDRAAGLATAIHVALSSGAWADAERWIAELQLLGDNYGTPRGIWQSRAFDASLLDCRGEVQRAAEVAEAARRTGRHLKLDDASLTYQLRILAQSLHREGLASFAPFIEKVDERYDFPIMHGLRALTFLDADRRADAGPVAGHLLDQLEDELDFFRSGALAVAALVFADLGDAAALATVREALSRRCNKFVFVGYGGPCLGPVTWFCGIAALAAGDNAEARLHFETAVTACKDVGARSLLATLRTSSRLAKQSS